MQAAGYRTRGPSSVIEVGEIPTPGPGPGEVRVRMQFAGVNPTDWKFRAAGPPLHYDIQVPCHDGSGTIEAVGSGVDPVRIGERVWVFLAADQRPWGTAAQYCVVPSRQAIALPPGVSGEFAAAIGVPFLTAHSCLFQDGPIDGQTIIIAGGAGAVGNAAIQLAVRAGAHVITTVSSDEKAGLAAKAGAQVIVNYREPDATERIRSAARAGVDRIIEVALGANLDLDLAVLAPHSTIVTYASEAKDPVIPTRALMTLNATLKYVILYGFTQPMISAGVDDITTALTENALIPLPFHHFSLSDTAAALDAVEGGAIGKVLIDIP